MVLHTRFETGFSNENNDSLRLKSASTSNLSGGKGSLSCSELKSRYFEPNNKQNQQQILHDPNGGELYYRELLTYPQFNISVHNKGYDALRWLTIYETGKYYEAHVQKRFLSILSEGKNTTALGGNKPLVLDVGANIGYYTLLSLSLGARVMSFEVNPANLLRLCESLELNPKMIKKEDASLFLKGVWNEEAVIPLVVPDNPGAAVLNPRAKDAKFSVPTITLSGLAKEMGWINDFNHIDKCDNGYSPPVTLLKIDIEGKEPHVITGASKLLQSGAVKNILVEMRRLGRGAAREAVDILLHSSYGVVVERKGVYQRLGIDESRKFMDELRNKLGPKSEDVWWQYLPQCG